MKISLKAAVLACAMVFTSSASAAVYDWTITSTLYNGSGQLTTEDTGFANVLLVTAFEGTLNSWEVALRAPNSYGNDNHLFPNGIVFPDVGQTSAMVSSQGIAFTADGLSWRLASDPQSPHPTTLTSICCFSVVSFSIEPANAPAVPEPTTWAMMLLGFGAVGYSMRFRRRTAARSEIA
jgi:hypothetical protein